MPDAVEACNPLEGDSPIDKWGPLLVLVAVLAFFLALGMGYVEPTGTIQKNAANILLVAGGGLLTHLVKEYEGGS